MTIVPSCAASSWYGRGLGSRQESHSMGPEAGEGWGRAGLLQAWELQAGCHLPSPTQTKYPALWVSEKFLASARPGLSGLKRPSFMEPGLLSALGLFFLFLTPGVQADWQTYPSMEGRGTGLGKEPGRGRKGRQRPRTDMELENV